MVLQLLGCCLRVLSLGIEKWGVDRWIHDRDWDGEECVWATSLVDMYAKCGNMEKAWCL